jgi:hypothetical protein
LKSRSRTGFEPGRGLCQVRQSRTRESFRPLTINWSTSSSYKERDCTCQRWSIAFLTKNHSNATYDQHADFTAWQAAVAGVLDHDVVEPSRGTDEDVDCVPMPVGEVCRNIGARCSYGKTSSDAQRCADVTNHYMCKVPLAREPQSKCLEPNIRLWAWVAWSTVVVTMIAQGPLYVG